MRAFEIIATTLWVAAVAGLSAGPAQAVVEVEPNETIATATSVPAPDVGDGFRTNNTDTDSYRFTGLVPGADYIVNIDNSFLGVGWFDNAGTLLDSLAFEGIFELPVVADSSGELVLVVCGHVGGFYDCTAQSAGGGPYTLSVPEPGVAQLSLTALILLSALRHRNKR